ncbi:MAG TPA: alkaline phosphatase family protein [Thermoanaerobaculia bacterium]|nr:alkaline phosphatase family protein [Thermoanaerobaculia bacterium]
MALLAVGTAVMACRTEAAAPIPEPVRRSLLFIGIDGATWRVMGPLIEQGELPTFERLVREGAFMPDFATMETTRSPTVWTTVATGREPSAHGITDYTARLPNGALIPVTSSQRRARAIWELASRRGLTVGVIGWWASWPAEDVKGYVVSDHANPAFADLLKEDGRYWTAETRELAMLGLDFLPVDLAPVLEGHWLPAGSFPWEDFRRRGGFTLPQVEALERAPWNDRTVHSWLKTFYRVDYPLVRIAADLARERPTDLQLVYLRGADPVQHYGWDLVEPELYARPPANLERDRGLVESVYRYLDTFVSELLASQRHGDWLIIASDHGAQASPHARRPHLMDRPGDHPPGSKGILIVHGQHVRRGFRLEEADPYDLFPTMAWLLGLPLSEELPGRPLMEAFDDRFVNAWPVHKIPSYGPRPTGPLQRSPVDEGMVESLRALGYVE